MATARDQLIGQAVIALRGDQTQQAVADAMRERGWKWSQATVWSVEKGDRPLRLAEAGDLAEVLGASVNDLLLDETEREIEGHARWVSRQRGTIEGATQQYVYALASFRMSISRALDHGSPLSDRVLRLAERWLSESGSPEEALRVGWELAGHPEGAEGSEERAASMETYKSNVSNAHAELLTRLRQLRG